MKLRARAMEKINNRQMSCKRVNLNIRAIKQEALDVEYVLKVKLIRKNLRKLFVNVQFECRYTSGV